MDFVKKVIKKIRAKRLFPILVILVAIPVTVYLVKLSQELRERASGGPASLTFVPGSQTKNAGEAGQFNVNLNPGSANVSSVELVITYDPSVINVYQILPGPFFTDPAPDIGDAVIIAEDLATPGRIHYALGFPLGSGYSSSNVSDVAIISFNAISQGTASLDFDVSSTPKAIVADINAQDVLGQAVSGAVNVSGGGASLYFSTPSPGNPQSIGNTFTLDVLANTAGEQIDAVDARIQFNQSLFAVTDVAEGTESAFTSYPALDFDNTAGTAIISVNIGGGASPTPAQGTGLHLGTLTFQALAETSGSQVTFDFVSGERNDSNMVRHGSWQTQDPVDILTSATGANIVVGAAPTATPTAIPTPTPTPTSAPISPTPTPIPSEPQGRNIAPDAAVTVSSEFNSGFNGYKAVDEIIFLSGVGEWASLGEWDPWIQLNWANPVSINFIRIFDRINDIDHSSQGTLSFSDGSSINISGIPNDGSPFNVPISERTVAWVRFQITGTPESWNNGLSEIEVYSTTTVTVTPTPTPALSQTMTIKLGFEGRLRSGVSKSKSVELSYKKAGETQVTTTNFTTNSNGEGTVDLAPGSYVFLFDSDGYLARRFGSDAYPVVIRQGDTVLDLSVSPLLGGDFNDDGEVNEVDYASIFLPSFLGSTEYVDLDGSGEVNNLDFAIMRANWTLVDDILP